ncbi:MAG: (2Fe-2S)-binding protein [Planctomycetes bacterium]|nr:(2Fe-2S)-binding protein [Planctomycetota bacterium]
MTTLESSTTKDTAATQTATLTLDGATVEFTIGETLYEVCQREQRHVPTLCYDDRLDAFGACRLCVVEVEGIRNPVASCTTNATAGMVVRSNPAKVDKFRKTLLEMVASENREVDVDPLRGHASQELTALMDRYDARRDRFRGKQSGKSKLDDSNPFLLRDYDLCISCYRCVRVCAEQEGDYAISVKGRGFSTQITVEFDGDLENSSCTFCGQCVQTCPTGALADKKSLRAVDVPGEIELTRTVCPYCGVGCSIDLMTKGDRIVGSRPAMDGPANKGSLCVKGQFAFDFIQHEERLKQPLVRGEDGQLHEATWDEALDRAARGFLEAKAKYGRKSVYAIASGRAPHEAAYATQKFVRVGFMSNYVDNCSRS